MALLRSDDVPVAPRCGAADVQPRCTAHHRRGRAVVARHPSALSAGREAPRRRAAAAGPSDRAAQLLPAGGARCASGRVAADPPARREEKPAVEQMTLLVVVARSSHSVRFRCAVPWHRTPAAPRSRPLHVVAPILRTSVHSNRCNRDVPLSLHASVACPVIVCSVLPELVCYLARCNRLRVNCCAPRVLYVCAGPEVCVFDCSCLSPGVRQNLIFVYICVMNI